MALDFPSNPTTNQVYTYSGKSWTWTGTFWNAINQGIQGTQGTQGIQGTQGTQGQQGIQGIQGTQGAQGLQGIQGTQGTQGNQGIQGIQGTQGNQGIQGIQGTQGTQGIQGIQGVQGTQGRQGIQGTQGAQGNQGIQGIQGTQGNQGITGSGAQGIQGIQGIQGTQGTIGAGVQGIQGAQGNQGIQGIQGTQGTQGIKGTKVSASDTPPSNPSPNDFWWDATYGVLMVYYDDGNSQQWVSAMSGISGIQGAAGPGDTITSTDDTSTNSTFYPVIVAGTGAQTAKISTSKLTFNPSTGDLAAAGNITAYFSDDRLKDRECNITGAIQKIEALNGFYFTPNEKAQSLGYEKKREVGVSAQEVEAVLPEIVTQAPVNPEYKTVYYDRLIPLLIEALKEQNGVIRKLGARVSELENSGKYL